MKLLRLHSMSIAIVAFILIGAPNTSALQVIHLDPKNNLMGLSNNFRSTTNHQYIIAKSGRKRLLKRSRLIRRKPNRFINRSAKARSKFRSRNNFRSLLRSKLRRR